MNNFMKICTYRKKMFVVESMHMVAFSSNIRNSHIMLQQFIVVKTLLYRTYEQSLPEFRQKMH